MERNQWVRRSDWFDAYRREPRWVDARMARVQLDGKEYLGLTGDVSLNGMRLALVGATPQSEDGIRVEVAFEREVIEMRGIVAHISPRPWGCLLGIQCEERNEKVRGFLSRRYLSSAEDFRYAQ
jgi:hypothetical protein